VPDSAFVAGDALPSTIAPAPQPALLRRAVFLDRDGVINKTIWNEREHLFDSPLRVEEVALLPRVADAIRLLIQEKWLVVVVSNQPVVAKQKTTPYELDRITRAIASDIERGGGRIDRFYYCLHHPNAAIDALRGPCACRKPQPGLIRQSARDLGIDIGSSFMVGDRVTDAEAGRAAGCTTILVAQDPGASRPSSVDQNSTDLYEAVQWILAQAARRSGDD
jgi:D-glycero-D-manno-heptose 1,7-bisphosphate phosphatase